ncbi:nucleic acid dioxygenase ALKBH1-like [Uloborus diversus]|uniref:nucleic acid dioxygenase ALKBH1-like n=1 Tax=Uloborus diversus TaxID=327109 RepID=UPI00240A5F9E|nr:nucleic acid dioxygenase ALKBH1-like [Uloborus diversus]
MHENKEIDLFRKTFRYYKSKNPPPKLCNVIDISSDKKHHLVECTNNNNQKSNLEVPNCPSCQRLGLKNHFLWQIFSFKSLKGFTVIKNPFNVAGQQKWIRKSLEVYPRNPSRTNLDSLNLKIDDIFPLHDKESWKTQTNVHKLRWATLGYHHNWDTKIYDESERTEFPSCLKELTKHIASCVGCENFEPEAAIINYYNKKSTLGIHDDHSEKNHDAPLISFSFGLTAILLMGTKLKTDEPFPLFLRSGDVVIMGGDSRLVYHAVPCIFKENGNSLPFNSDEDKSWEPFNEYIKKSRINISVRQVNE